MLWIWRTTTAASAALAEIIAKLHRRRVGAVDHVYHGGRAPNATFSSAPSVRAAQVQSVQIAPAMLAPLTAKEQIQLQSLLLFVLFDTADASHLKTDVRPSTEAWPSWRAAGAAGREGGLSAAGECVNGLQAAQIMTRMPL